MLRYTPPPADLFTRNRDKFRAKMAPGAAALFFANTAVPSNADAAYAFVQNSGFYYLAGIDQEDAALLLFPNAPKDSLREILFVKRTNEKIQVWEGWKYSLEEAAAASGVKEVRYIDELEGVFRHLISHFGHLYLDFNEHDRNTLYMETPAHAWAQRMAREFPAHRLERANPIISDLRLRKEPQEVQAIQQAVDITHKALLRVLRFVQPGRMEYEIEAEIHHEFLRHGSSGPAYGSIIAGGKNSCVLHYVLNSQPVKDGDVLLMDFGARYGNYAADLTRTIPVNGKFTKRQREVYNAVLRVLRRCTDQLQPGQKIEDYWENAGNFVTEELLQLGLITQQDVKAGTKEKPAYKKYFMHGIGHPLGLDIHDVGNHRYGQFQVGWVMTVEPGIYIPEEGIGVRIENNVLITPQGPQNLMQHFPTEAEEIEELMHARVPA
jgi:Xaa-Pro aminopeptidase